MASSAMFRAKYVYMFRLMSELECSYLKAQPLERRSEAAINRMQKTARVLSSHLRLHLTEKACGIILVTSIN